MFALDPNDFSQKETLKNLFAELSTNLVTLLSKENIKTAAYREGLPYFSALSINQQIATVNRLKFYHDLCTEQVSEGQSLRDSKRFTWRALVKLSLSPHADFLNRITEGDIIELYNEDGVQVFRNLEFFDFCSYCIEELYCVEWWRLFQRDDQISSQLLEMIPKLFQKKYPEGLEAPLPRHQVVETFSRDKFHIDFFMKYIGPLFHNKRVSALICIEKASLA